ncbi:hypothetical protein CLAIMM_14393 [Cladophialophora immunda]|nr:hypothetical protein CLAIMM_14393 [Cladophialophora immunda]
MFGQQPPSTYTSKRIQLHAETTCTSEKTVDGTSRGTRQSSTALVINESRAQGNIFQDVEAGPDAHQVIVGTRDVICAKGVIAAKGATQWLGQMSDRTLQQMEYCRNKGRSESKAGENEELQIGKIILHCAGHENIQKSGFRIGAMTKRTKESK